MAFIALLSPDTTHCIKNFAEELFSCFTRGRLRVSSKILEICEGVMRNFEIYHGSIPAIHHGKLKENIWT